MKGGMYMTVRTEGENNRKEICPARESPSPVSSLRSVFYTCFEKFILSLFMVKKCRGYNQKFSLSLFKPKKRGVYAQKIYPLTFSAKKSGS